MKTIRLVLLSALVTAHILCVQSVCGAAPVKYRASGTYVDSSGGQHAWQINDAHTLIWDGEPYIPVGGVFEPRYISLGQTEQNFEADKAALDTIKSRGITDVLLRGGAPITKTDPAAWQKIIDYLDAQGFNYGIEINDGPAEPLKGCIVSPSSYRLEGPNRDTHILLNWPDVDSAVYVVVNTFDNQVTATGGAVVKDGKVSIYLNEELKTGQVLLVFPRKVFPSVDRGGTGDIWDGFGEYRDRLMLYLGGIKFGPGLRFFLEPFAGGFDFTGEMAGFIPDSSGFRVGFEAYLYQKRKHEGSINSAWGLNENLNSVETAARLIPLWNAGRGVPYAYDRASAHLYPVDVGVSQVWHDITDYRDSSAQRFMNSIADAIKKQVADVPVIFKCSQHHRIYANPYGAGGFDGLGAVAYGTGSTPVTSAAGEVYSLAEESGKTTWFIAAATQTSAENKVFIGYADELAMTAALDSLREVGCKGFFVRSLQELAEDDNSNFSLIKDPRQLDWLANFKNRLDAQISEFKPEVVYYPLVPPVGAYVKRLAPNTWWLPTLRTGRTTYIGDGLSAYTILGEDKSYLWSGTGPRTITLKSGPTGFPTVAFPDGADIQKQKDGYFTVELDQSPLVLRGMDFSIVFPRETAQQAIDRLAALIPEADKLEMDVRKAKESLDSAKMVLNNGQPMIAYGIAQTALEELVSLFGANVWLEGESSRARNFGEVTAAPGASGALALVLDTDLPPPMMDYTVTFYFDADANASYELWIAGTPPQDGSPVSYSVDDASWIPVTSMQGTLQEYAPGLSWYKVGTTNLGPGRHTIKIRADRRREQDNRYYFALDAVVLSPKGFQPNGVEHVY